MKAIRYHDYGSSDVLRLEEIPQPEPGPGQVRVAVHAAGLNPADWKVRAGKVKHFVPLTFPAIPGGDIAGVVDAVGEGVTGFRAGDAVFAMTGLLGGYTQCAVIAEAQVARIPSNLDFVHAAGVPLASLTAWQALVEAAGVKPGQTVLIHAAAGGVGSFAVQIAKHLGAEVIGTASAANHEYVRSLGAKRCIDYDAAPFETQVEPVDVVLDLMGGEIGLRSMKVVKPGGVLVSVSGAPQLPPLDDQGRRNAGVFVKPRGDQLAQIAKLIEKNIVRTTVAAVFPLEQAAKAQDLVAQGHVRGKIVLQVR